MTHPQSRITIGNLPPRARQLKASEMSAVFGGCVDYGAKCDDKNTCCPRWTCRSTAISASSSLGAMVGINYTCN
jgi:hypothetical protein